MVREKKHTPEQIVNVLWQIEVAIICLRTVPVQEITEGKGN
jgi:hypothetical protein